MQSVRSRIWTRVAVSISYDDNHYTMSTSNCNIASTKLLIGLAQTVSESPKAKHDATYLSTKKNTLILSSNLMTLVDEYKFLGIIFDRKFTFIPHIKYLKNKSTQAQQILWVVVHTEWGADWQMLLKLYIFLIHSKPDDAIFIYRSVRRSYLKQLDPIHH